MYIHIVYIDPYTIVYSYSQIDYIEKKNIGYNET